MAVELATENAIALVTIDRQEAMNALDLTTLRALRDVLAGLAADPGIRCVIVTGAGERAFSGGADLKYMARVDADRAVELAELGHETGRLLETMPKPTIAAINGYALGGGCELALACDIRYASPHARLGQPEVDYGLVPGWGGTQRLARATTLGFAKELILTGRLVDADEAYRRGLVEAIHAPVLARAFATARLVTRKGPEALAAAKSLLNRSLGGDHDESLRAECTALAHAILGAEGREGLAAFVEKRPPGYALDEFPHEPE
jgi:enoyl-CoA hydratase